ncbi:polyphosphate--glucose phosphotransferase [Granulicoccus sp. GXG6511]|uniref:polyphosphate--glucose phosphotransferase n=1 Tax=Granulicoccus sp. GXG6511 TaxID=3381351 RepID=UPI003D7CE034
MSERPVLGIDIGGSGIKGAPVDLAVGDWATERLRIDTPAKSTPKNVAKVVRQIVDHFADQIGDGPIGVTVPAVVMHGVTRSAANIDKAWIGFPVEQLFADTLGREVAVVNDADAAGVCEVKYGAAKDHPGLVLVTTLGTGIGSAILHNGVLIPNAELGHIEIDGHDAETRASAGVKDRKGWSMAEWIPRIERYYQTLERLLWPDLIVVGGGISREHDQFLPKLRLNTPIVPAAFRNRAGIIGAARLAHDRLVHPDPLDATTSPGPGEDRAAEPTPGPATSDRGSGTAQTP